MEQNKSKQPVLPIAVSNLWDIASNLENIQAVLDRNFNLLFIYVEELDAELGFLRGINNGRVAHFLDRYEVLRSLVDTVYSLTYDASAQMRTHIDEIYDIDRRAAT